MNPLMEEVLNHSELADLDPAARRLALRSIVAQSVAREEMPALLSVIADTIDGFGPLTKIMQDPDVTDVFVNGHTQVWIERRGALELTDVVFRDETELLTLIERIVGEAGGRVDLAHPIGDARLADGSRVHVVLPPVASGAPLVSIRRWPRMPFSLDDLVDFAMLAAGQADTLRRAVSDRATIAISGSTGSGKTTLLNALLGCIGPNERVVTIEETAELRPPCPHAVSLLARRSNVEGKGEITLPDLVRASLRMRPDRIIVGEVRGREMVAALAALSTGHEGSMLTIHARSPRDAIERMVTLALSGEIGSSEVYLRRRIESAFDLIVHLDRSDGRRTVVAIEEVRARAG
jgi:pilus assembly protein CpaF